MTTHNKLLLTAIAAIGAIGFVGSTLAARSGAVSMAFDPVAEADRDDRPMRIATRSRIESDHGRLMYEEAFSNIEALEVMVGDADIVVQEGSGSNATVEVFIDTEGDDAWAEDLFERMDFRAEASRGGLYVEAEDPRVSREEWQSRRRGFDATVVITGPAGMDATLRTSDGDIEVERLIGRTHISTSDGDVFLGEGEGELLEIGTSDGDIMVESLHSERARITTGDGDVSLEEVTSELSASSGDGDIRVVFAEAVDARINTGDGDITLVTPRTIRATFFLEAEDLNIAPGMELEGRVRDESIEGRLNGGGPRIEAETGDGSITLRGS